METISFTKRFIYYFINIIAYLSIGFSIALPFLLLSKVNVGWYIIIGIGFTIALGVIIRYILIRITHGYTFISFILHVKYIGEEEKDLKVNQTIIRTINEAIPFLLLLDLIYLKTHHTERGVIDRISNSFTIDLNRE